MKRSHTMDSFAPKPKIAKISKPSLITSEFDEGTSGFSGLPVIDLTAGETHSPDQRPRSSGKSLNGAKTSGKVPLKIKEKSITFHCTASIKDLRMGNHENFCFYTAQSGEKGNRDGRSGEHVRFFFDNFCGNAKLISTLRNDIEKRDAMVSDLNQQIDTLLNKVDNAGPDYFSLLESTCIAAKDIKAKVKEQVCYALARDCIDDVEKAKLLKLLKEE